MNNIKAKKPKLVIIGAGIIGITIAREARLSKIFGEIIIVEKERNAGFHATSRNSGVIHAGFYYSPDSKKGKFCAEGNSLMRNYILNNSLKYNPCGKVVVSKNQFDDETLEILHERGIKNNCEVYLFKSEKLRDYENLAKTNNLFLWSPNTWSASPVEVLNCILDELKEYDVKIYLNKKIIATENNYIVLDHGEKMKYDFLVNASGGYSINVAKLFGLKTKYKILPFKGLYLKSKQKSIKFKRHIYPVPDIKQPFLGIHTTITSDGYLKLGPTAMPVLSPENYTFFERLDFSITPEILSLQMMLFMRNTFEFRDLAFREYKYLFKENIIKEAEKLVSADLKNIPFEWYSPGIRAQLYDTESEKLENDIVVENLDNTFHLLNSISPSWTCSFKTASYVIAKIKEIINL